MSKWLTLIALVLMLVVDEPCASARGFSVFDLSEVSLTYRSFFPGGHDPLITDTGLVNKQLGKEMDLSVNTSLLRYLYWNNTIHSLTDADVNAGGGQFRMVGWEFGLGIDFRKISSSIPLTAGYYHYSQHSLDHEYPWHFPVRDAIELKLLIYQADTSKK